MGYKSGLKILVNPLAFSAFSDFLVKNDVNETLEDIKIITEYEIEDLKCVVDFVSQGICPKTIESWAEMTLAYSELFADFGIRLQHVLSVKKPHKTGKKKITHSVIFEILPNFSSTEDC